MDSLYSKISDQNIRLTRCRNCGLVVDKYVEFESTLVFIDIILLRTQAYRHILFNRYDSTLVEVAFTEH
jgi:hypothetical protein